MNTSSGSALEKGLATKLRELLAAVPWLEKIDVADNPARFNRAFDLLVKFNIPQGPVVELWVDCRADPRPAHFPYVAVERDFDQKGNTKCIRTRVFGAPHISERMAEICESHHWNWFDLAGNCHISIPRFLHIDRKGNPPLHKRPRPTANLSTPEAGRVIRTLLAPENGAITRWTQRELQKECGLSVSVGLINKVVRYLREEAYITGESKGGFRLNEPLKLLYAWRDAYRFDLYTRGGYFTLLQGKQLRDALSGLGMRTGGHIVYASFSAAEFQAPYVRQPKTWLFVRQDYLPMFEKSADAKVVDSGENLVVLIPDDEGVFSFVESPRTGDSRLGCTNLVQTYIDLWYSGGRGQEAAEALLEQRIKPAWRDKNLPV